MKILALTWLLLISSCVEKKPGTSILTTNIFNQATFSINEQDASGKTLDLGEHLLTDPAIVATVKVYNGTDYPYTDLELEFLPDGEYSSSTNFLASQDGAVSFPGEGGTCKKILPAKSSCTMKIEISPREGRIFKENLKLSYKHLVEAEEHTATLTFLAGMPASLIFTSERDSQYTFGEPAGPEKEPTVERADGEVYLEHLEIKNVGGLKAQNLKLKLDEFCTNKNDLLPPSEQVCLPAITNVYQLDHNCPQELMPGEVCQLTIRYQAKNQDPPGATDADKAKVAYINYEGTFTAEYVTSSAGKTAILPAYFKSFSRNIQAEFRTNNKVITFDQEVVSGNRDKRTLTLQNRGTRTGYLLHLSIHDQSNNFLANCFAQSGTKILNCVDSVGESHTLSSFPFTIKDVRSCLSTETDKKHIEVSQSCDFEITFQPSVTFTQPKTTEFQGLQINATWDALFKGLETIVYSGDLGGMSTLNAKSTSQAQVIVERIRLGTTDYYLSSQGLPALADFGRMALQTREYGVSKTLQVVFKNIGKTRATNLVIKDGRGTTIPRGSSINLGAHGPDYYYLSASANSSTCEFINEGASCAVQISFKPVALGDGDMEKDNMYDLRAPGAETGFKIFNLTYDSGVKFTDDNREAEKDYPLQNAQAQITAKLLYKGILMELGQDDRNHASFGMKTTANDEFYRHFYLRNIGTGPIPYVQALALPPAGAWELIRTPTDRFNQLKTIRDVHYDCFDVVDLDTTNSSVSPAGRTMPYENWLQSNKSCVFTIKIKQPNENRRVNSSSCSDAPTEEEDSRRLFYVGSNNQPDLWEVCSSYVSGSWQTARFRYFDGDGGNGVAGVDQTYGFEFRTNQFQFEMNSHSVAKFSFKNFSPFLTATAYRPTFTLPNLGTGLPEQSAKTIPETWFYGIDPRIYSRETVPDLPPLIKANHSRHFVKELNSFKNNKNDYEYIYYAGSFPSMSGRLNFTPRLFNNGSASAILREYKVSRLSGNKITCPSTLGPYPKTVAGELPFNCELDTNVTGEPSEVGEQVLEVEIKFETGEFESGGNLLFYNPGQELATPLPPKKIKTLKFLIVANITSDHPQLTAEVVDYEMNFGQTGDLLPPTESDPLPAGLSWNYNAPEANCPSGSMCTLDFNTVKISGTPSANDPYAKKRLILKNTGSEDIQDLTQVFRFNATGSLDTTVPSSFSRVAAETTCGTTLAQGTSCQITYQYKPNASDTGQTIVWSFIYRSPAKEYFMQNIGLKLTPVSPGRLVADRGNPKQIRYKATPSSTTQVRSSYELALPSGQTLSQSPTTPFQFVTDSGTLKRVKLTNPEPTKTSLLLAYQKYVTQNGLTVNGVTYSPANPAPSSLVPPSYETVSEVVNGVSRSISYANIHLSKYSGTETQRLRIQASKGCFFGDDESDDEIPAHQKGFKSSTSANNPCLLRIYFYANLEYLNRKIDINDGDMMRDNAAEIWYYTVNRSASASLWIHLTGTLLPDPSVASLQYTAVRSQDNRRIIFKTPDFAPNNEVQGDVVGVRVYMTTIETNLNNIYTISPTTIYEDARFKQADGRYEVTFSTGLQNSNYYFFKAVAIRQNSQFKNEGRFVGLAEDEYLSDATTESARPVLKVLVPPLGYYYFHDEKLLFNKDLQLEFAAYTWPDANSACTGAKVKLYSPTQKDFSSKLISIAEWNLIKDLPAANVYAASGNIDHMIVPHWTRNAEVTDLYDELEWTGLEPNQESDIWEDFRIFYFKDIPPTNPLRIIVGAMPRTDLINFTSYVPGAIEFGNARCVIHLD